MMPSLTTRGSHLPASQSQFTTYGWHVRSDNPRHTTGYLAMSDPPSSFTVVQPYSYMPPVIVYTSIHMYTHVRKHVGTVATFIASLVKVSLIMETQEFTFLQEWY